MGYSLAMLWYAWYVGYLRPHRRTITPKHALNVSCWRGAHRPHDASRIARAQDEGGASLVDAAPHSILDHCAHPCQAASLRGVTHTQSFAAHARSVVGAGCNLQHHILSVIYVVRTAYVADSHPPFHLRSFASRPLAGSSFDSTVVVGQRLFGCARVGLAGSTRAVGVPRSHTACEVAAWCSQPGAGSCSSHARACMPRCPPRDITMILLVATTGRPHHVVPHAVIPALPTATAGANVLNVKKFCVPAPCSRCCPASYC